MPNGSQVSSLIFGGVFIAVWLYICLLGIPNEFDSNDNFSVGAWSFWGFVGLLLAGAVYGTRVSRGWLRVILYCLIGIAIGMLAMAFFFDEIVEGLAALVTLVGGGLIVSVLPVVLREDPYGQAQ